MTSTYTVESFISIKVITREQFKIFNTVIKSKSFTNSWTTNKLKILTQMLRPMWIARMNLYLTTMNQKGRGMNFVSS